jgi:Uncharacterised protein family (UPF0158)
MKLPTTFPQPLPRITRQQFHHLNKTGEWRITTHQGMPWERTSVIDAFIMSPPSGDSGQVWFFDSHTHAILAATDDLWEEDLGDSAEEVREFLRSQPEQFWELPQSESCDARSELEDYIESVSDDGRRSALASAINTRQAFRSFAEEATDEERIDWRGFEEEWKHWMLWNFFLEHGVQPEAVGEDT